MKSRISFSALLTYSMASLIMSPSPAAAKQPPCAKVQVETAGKCPDLKVNFELSACGETAIAPSRITCDGDKVNASVATKAATYSVTLEENESWGNISHVPTGPVVRTAIVTKKETKEKPKAEKVKPEVKASPVSEEKSISESDLPGGLEVNGVLDVYYQFAFHRPAAVAAPTTNNAAGNVGIRAFDSYHNQFALNLAQLSLKKATGEVQLNLTFDFGPTADINSTGSDTSTTPATSVVDEVSKHISQANVTYAPEGLPGFSVTAGKLLSHVGYESYRAVDDWQYSRSIVNTFMPAWHSGIAVAFPVVPEILSSSIYVYNGWNSLYDNNNGKTFGLQVRLTPHETLSMTYNLITGPEVSASEDNWRTVNEAYLVYSPVQWFALAVEGLVGVEPEALDTLEDGKWGGATLHAKFQPLDWYIISPRFEYYHDRSGYSLGGFVPAGGTTNRFFGSTLTQTFMLTDELQTRLEFRYDRAIDNSVFTAHDAGLSKNQASLTAAAIYAF